MACSKCKIGLRSMLLGVSRWVGAGLDWQGNKVFFAVSVRVLLLGRSRGLGG